MDEKSKFRTNPIRQGFGSSTQDTQDILNKVIRCCDENDWFGK